MFGMLDYRAHKLYMLLFFIPSWIGIVVSVVGIPLLASEFVNKNFDHVLAKLLIGLVLLFVFEMILGVFFLILGWIYKKIFLFIVDVVPSGDRANEQAWNVVLRGEIEVMDQKMTQVGPSHWTDDDIEKFIDLNPLLVRLFFRDNMRNRLEFLRSHYSVDDAIPDAAEMRFVLEKNKMTMGWEEKVAISPAIRRTIYSVLIFVYLIG